ncbi:hypothetical protein N9P85_00595 [Amylibacter sp.]|nr:hypothetical protein [Amylibacter sp.]
MLIDKKKLVGRVEPFILDQIQGEKVELVSYNSIDLLTPSRFDVALKLAFLSLRSYVPDFANEIYYNDIRAQTLGNFSEIGDTTKNSFEKYIKVFEDTFQSITRNGFDENLTVLPLDRNNSILNGSHRLSSAILNKKRVSCILTNLTPMEPTYEYFRKRNVPDYILDVGAIKYAEFSENCYLAFLWPSGRNNAKFSENLFKKVVYKKNIKLNRTGAENLLIELYKHMDWSGVKNHSFTGIYQKLSECFTDFGKFTVIMFEADSLDEVREIKKQIREINNIGYSSVHITDTKEEVIRISKLLFNHNSIHFLNTAQPYRLPGLQEKFRMLREHLGAKRDISGLLLCGSNTLGVYGIRRPRDIDYLASGEQLSIPEFDFYPHDSQLDYYSSDKLNLIYNPNYYFEYLGFKFLAFSEAFNFKTNRGEPKDEYDCASMKLISTERSYYFMLQSFQKYLLYKMILILGKSKYFIFLILKVTRTYRVVRGLYRQFKKWLN